MPNKGEWHLFGDEFPQEDGKAIDIIFGTTVSIDVSPVLWWNVSHRTTLSSAVCLRFRISSPLRQTKVTDL